MGAVLAAKSALAAHRLSGFVNEVAMAGVTYGWGPAGSGAIAFVDEKGHVLLFDRDGEYLLMIATLAPR